MCMESEWKQDKDYTQNGQWLLMFVSQTDHEKQPFIILWPILSCVMIIIIFPRGDVASKVTNLRWIMLTQSFEINFTAFLMIKFCSINNFVIKFLNFYARRAILRMNNNTTTTTTTMTATTMSGGRRWNIF